MSGLIDITQNEAILTSLFELYGRNSCQESLGHYTLKNYIAWLQKVPDLEYTKIYTYGDWQQSGLYLIMDRYQVILNSLRPNDTDLYEALKLIDWSYGHKIYPVPAEHYDIVMRTIEELQIPHWEIKMSMYKLPCEDALNWQMPCPADYEVSTLRTEDAELVNSLWPATQEGSIHFIRRCIAMNFNVALRRRDNGKLVAWCFRDSRGLIGTLQVIDECQRQGLATYVTCQFARKMAAQGDHIWATVREANLPSRRCFEKMKFSVYSNVCVINTTTAPGALMWTKD